MASGPESLWGYFQVRTDVNAIPLPPAASPPEISLPPESAEAHLIDLKREVNLLEMVDLETDRVGWRLEAQARFFPPENPSEPGLNCLISCPRV